MEKVYGIEMIRPVNKLPGFIAQVVKKTAEIAVVFDREQNLLIVKNKVEATELMNYYDSKDVLGETYNLYLIDNPHPYSIFTDYGFVSMSRKHYLFEEMTIPFEITSGHLKDIEMANLQFEEHLIAKEQAGTIYCFIDKHLKELVQGIATAYKINVRFVSN